MWGINYVFFFPHWASDCIHWLCIKYVPTHSCLTIHTADDLLKVHKDVINKVKVLHHNISLLNLLIIAWYSSGDGNQCLNFLNFLPQDIHVCLQTKIKNIMYCGLLGDWVYTIPLDVPSCIPQSMPPTSSLSLPPTFPALPPKHQPSGDPYIPVHISVSRQHKDWVAHIVLSELWVDHDIVLSMGRDQLLDPSSLSINTNPLYCTIGFSLHEMIKPVLTKVF